MRKHCSNVCKFCPCLATESTNSAPMRTIVTAGLQRQYSQTELIFWITLVQIHLFNMSDGSEFVYDVDMNIFWDNRYCIHVHWEATVSWIQPNILLNINDCPTRCNTKQPICYFASSLYMFRVSTTPNVRSAQNCNYSLRYCSYLPPTWPATLEGGSCTKITTSTGGCSYSLVYSWWRAWLRPETCTVNLQNNK